MPQEIQLKRSAVPGKVPTIYDLDLGEIGINTHDGRVFLKQKDAQGERIIELGVVSGSVASNASASIGAPLNFGYGLTSNRPSYNSSLITDLAVNRTLFASSAEFYAFSQSIHEFTASYYIDSASFDIRINSISGSGGASGSFILDQFAFQQPASFWIDGPARIDGEFLVFTTDQGNYKLQVSGGFFLSGTLVNPDLPNNQTLNQYVVFDTGSGKFFYRSGSVASNIDTSIFVTTSSFGNFTQSIHTWSSSINIYTSSLNSWTASIHVWTSSIKNWTSSINNITRSFQLYIQSLNTWTSSIHTWSSSINNFTASISSSFLNLSSSLPSFYFKQGGNSFGTNAILGTNDNFQLILEVSGSEVARFRTNGNLKFNDFVQNRVISLLETADNDHQFYGLGINVNTLRFQIPDYTTDSFIWYGGTGTSTSSEIMRLGAGGKLILNYTDQGNFKLQVSGSAIISGALLNQGITNNQSLTQFVMVDTGSGKFFYRSGSIDTVVSGFVTTSSFNAYTQSTNNWTQSINSVTRSFLLLSASLDTTYFKQGGNSFGTVASFGTNDNNYILVKTNNSEVFRIGTNGELRFNNFIQNRVISLYTTADNDHQFYGFGINSDILRFQIPDITNNYIWYSGVDDSNSNELMRLKGNGELLLGNPIDQGNYKLQVSGGFFLSGTLVNPDLPNSQSYNQFVMYDTGSGKFFYRSGSFLSFLDTSSFLVSSIFNNFSQSIHNFTSSIKNYTQSINIWSSSINLFTQSIYNWSSSINGFTASISSSNLFIRNQTSLQSPANFNISGSGIITEGITISRGALIYENAAGSIGFGEFRIGNTEAVVRIAPTNIGLGSKELFRLGGGIHALSSGILGKITNRNSTSNLIGLDIDLSHLPNSHAFTKGINIATHNPNGFGNGGSPELYGLYVFVSQSADALGDSIGAYFDVTTSGSGNSFAVYAESGSIYVKDFLLIGRDTRQNVNYKLQVYSNALITGSVLITGSTTISSSLTVNTLSSPSGVYNLIVEEGGLFKKVASSSFLSPSIDVSYLVTTSSFNLFTQSIHTWSSSINSWTSSIHNFTSSIIGAVSSSVTGTINYIPKFINPNRLGNSLIFESGSFLYISESISITGSGTFKNLSGSLDKIIKTNEFGTLLTSSIGESAIILTSSFNAFTSSVLRDSASFDIRINSLTASFHSFSQSINLFTQSIAGGGGAAVSASVTGTINYIPKFINPNRLGNSLMFESASILYVSESINITGSGTFMNMSGSGGFKLVQVNSYGTLFTSSLDTNSITTTSSFNTFTSSIHLGNNQVAFYSASKVTGSPNFIWDNQAVELRLGGITDFGNFTLQVAGATVVQTNGVVTGIRLDNISQHYAESSFSMSGTNRFAFGAGGSSAVTPYQNNAYFQLLNISSAFVFINTTSSEILRITNTGKFIINMSDAGDFKSQIGGNSYICGNLQVTSSLNISGSAYLSGSTTISSSLTLNTLPSPSGIYNVLIEENGLVKKVASSSFLNAGIDTSIFVITSSFNTYTASINSWTSSVNTGLLTVSSSLYENKNTGSFNTGSYVIYNSSTSSYDALFLDYVIISGSNKRAGNFIATWSGSTSTYTDNSTMDIGRTNGVSFVCAVTGSNASVLVIISGSNGWRIKSIYRNL